MKKAIISIAAASVIVGGSATGVALASSAHGSHDAPVNDYDRVASQVCPHYPHDVCVDIMADLVADGVLVLHVPHNG